MRSSVVSGPTMSSVSPSGSRSPFFTLPPTPQLREDGGLATAAGAALGVALGVALWFAALALYRWFGSVG
jgi:hypothetical protein